MKINNVEIDNIKLYEALETIKDGGEVEIKNKKGKKIKIKIKPIKEEEVVKNL